MVARQAVIVLSMVACKGHQHGEELCDLRGGKGYANWVFEEFVKITLRNRRI